MNPASGLLTARPASLLAALLATAFCVGLSQQVLAADPSEEPPEEPPAAETADAAEQASTPPAPPVPRQLPYPEAARHLAIQEYLTLYQRNDEIVPLISDEQAFYGLFLPGRSATPQGGILILHDLEQHGHWPILVAPLREDLPEYGWTTLAIELPVPYTQPEPAVDATADNAEGSEAEPEALPQENTASEETVTEDEDANGPGAGSSPPQQEFDENNEPPLPPLESLPPLPEETAQTDTPEPQSQPDYDVIVTARIQSGLNNLYDRGQMNLVIIAIGDTAPLAANAVRVWQRERQEDKGITLVLIDARENPSTQLPLNDSLKTLSIPVLDLVTLDNRETQWQLQTRSGMMKRLHNDSYQQITLSGVGAEHPSTLRRVRGWLKKNAAGTELP